MFETKTVVKLHDTDAAGIAFFVNHFRIAHTAYEAFMKSVGAGLDEIIRSADYFVLIAHAEADYERPLFHGQAVTISLQAESVGNSSFVLGYEFKTDDGEVAARVRTVHVTIDKKTADKVPLPKPVYEGLKSLG
jgi:1,4-dihydroxy-2-naphthoyl-CoA hydrolase